MSSKRARDGPSRIGVARLGSSRIRRRDPESGGGRTPVDRMPPVVNCPVAEPMQIWSLLRQIRIFPWIIRVRRR
ncbi:hypothetical protein Poly41_47580 [Novipirellula artificiosorum]|uniref:Uncharacterized protein n=1 Tax=Novipirellula artificiosorum TaxID=2528016 RepID=A0A5C6DDI8_9BACT|nr:hypothetical protein Poly41_47580 [Novipirellula artificiosorum]